MTFNMRTVIGGYLTAFAPVVIGIVAPPDPIAGPGTVGVSFMILALAAGLVAYFVVFTGVKNGSHRLGAAAAVAPLFLILDMVLFDLVGRWLPALLPLLGGVISLSVVAAAFVAAVALVVRIAAGKKVKLAV